MVLKLNTGETVDVVEVRNYAYGRILYFLDEKTGNIYSIDDLDINETLARDIDSRICAHLEICGETDPKRKEYKRLKYEAIDALDYIRDSVINYVDYYAQDRENMERLIESNMEKINDLTSFFNSCKTLYIHEE